MLKCFFGWANRPGAGGDVPASQALAGKEMVGLYFGAAWCGPCVRFTPVLDALYRQAPKDKLEVVFVSSCVDEAQHAAYTKDMPWPCIPYRDASNIGFIRKAIRDDTGKLQGRLANLFSIISLPTFIILDKNGKTIRRDGRNDVESQAQVLDALKIWENLKNQQQSNKSMAYSAAGITLLVAFGGAFFWRSRTSRT